MMKAGSLSGVHRCVHRVLPEVLDRPLHIVNQQ